MLMNDLEIKKGIMLKTKTYGLIKVIDIYISVTDQSRVFLIEKGGEQRIFNREDLGDALFVYAP